MRYTKNGGRKLSHEVNESNPIMTIFMSLSSDTLSITCSFVNIFMIANELEKISHQNVIFRNRNNQRFDFEFHDDDYVSQSLISTGERGRGKREREMREKERGRDRFEPED